MPRYIPSQRTVHMTHEEYACTPSDFYNCTYFVRSGGTCTFFAVFTWFVTHGERLLETVHVSLFILNQHYEQHPGVILHSQFRPTHPFQIKCMDSIYTVLFRSLGSVRYFIYLFYFLERILLFSKAALQYIDQ